MVRVGARARFSALITVALLVGSAVPAPLAGAGNKNSEITQTKGFRKAVTVEGIRAHQAALQAIADANGGSRVSGYPGYEESAQYVYDTMTAAGYEVAFQEFQYTFSGDVTPPTMVQLAPVSQTFVNGVDFASMTGSGSGSVTASVVAVDLVIPSPAANTSTSGCEAADFAGFPAGSIALMQRGSCAFAAKALNAEAAGAAASIIMNEGDSPGRSGVIFGTLLPSTSTRPAVGTSTAVGIQLAGGVLNGPTGSTVHIETNTTQELVTTRNVIAETPSGDPAHTVVVGAHLDSVAAGPGIQDNGSGSSALLEIAEAYAAGGHSPRNKVRFIWFGAEEANLLGSAFYVNQLTAAERDEIELMLNFDMIGSPNYVRFVYDGDNSAFPVGPGAAAGPPGSAELERIFADYFTSQGLASEETAFSGRSDYGPFIAVGIPAGGLFTGAEGLKTAAQAAEYGGTAGIQYDPCYHLACDTFDNVSITGLDEMSDAAAHAFLLMTKRNFDREPLTATAAAADASLRRTSVGGASDAPAPASDEARLDR